MGRRSAEKQVQSKAAAEPKWIRINTEIPGPRSRQLLEIHEQFVAKPISLHAPVVVDRAEGATITDVDGNQFIDLTGGIGVLNVGHRHPRVLAALQGQLDRFLHTDYTVLPYESLMRLAERLAAIAPGDFRKKSFFFNSGAEAVENAVKIARAYTGRPAVLSFEGGFHGRTWMAMSLTGRVRPYKKNFGPFAPDVYRMPFPYVYRKPVAISDDEYADLCLRTIERAFVTTVDPTDIAAVVVEPVQGEAGFIVPPPNFLSGLQELCRGHGILLIADEVQTGFGRTGAMFASEIFGIEPDLLVVAKSLAAGLPLSGVIGRAEVMDGVQDSGIGGTYVGNPLGCVAALAVLDIMAEEDLPARSRQAGALLMKRFRALQDRCSLVGDVRGLGSMVAIELVRDPDSREPADRETAHILKQVMNRGVLVLKAGMYGNCIRILAPLAAPDDALHEALDVIETMIEECAAAPAGLPGENGGN